MERTHHCCLSFNFIVILVMIGCIWQVEISLLFMPYHHLYMTVNTSTLTAQKLQSLSESSILSTKMKYLKFKQLLRYLCNRGLSNASYRSHCKLIIRVFLIRNIVNTIRVFLISSPILPWWLKTNLLTQLSRNWLKFIPSHIWILNFTNMGHLRMDNSIL